MDSIPSKKQVKLNSGRRGRKQFNGQKTLQRVGGKLVLVEAIGMPSDYKLCRTYEEVGRKVGFTKVVGGSCSTGYIGGRG